MLREASNVSYLLSGWRWRPRRQLRIGRQPIGPRLRPGAFEEQTLRQRDQPLAVALVQRRCYWRFHDRFFWEDQGLAAQDVRALVLERERRQRRRLEHAHALMRAEEAPQLVLARRPGIPLEVRRAVWERDGGRCAECGAPQLLEFDHVIPLALGGASTAPNLQLLCAACNRAKGSAL